ncbi:kelch domain-containing protein 1-like isoform X4 [Danio rerio]|uniref:Kelch domain-containing protein 1-like isoform X4 n=1 Tax=Danio rerio TaxID=7955 RepID=A0AC58HPV6_DANRE
MRRELLCSHNSVFLGLENRRSADFKGWNLDQIRKLQWIVILEEVKSNLKESPQVSSPWYSVCEDSEADPAFTKKRGPIKRRSWSKQEVHAVVKAEPLALKTRDWIVFFGGYGPKLLREVGDLQSFTVDEASWADGVFWGWNNETHQFDPERRSWTEVQTTGGAPAPRAAHASATIGCKGFICGGRVKDTRTSDLHCLDFSSWTWSEIVCSGASPTGRSWHTLTAVSHTALFLFGGLSVDCRPMSDVWIFNLETNHWMKMKHKHTHRPRLWHTASAGADADVVVFGGSGDNILLMDTGHCSDVLVFQTQPYPLSRLCQDCISLHISVSQTLLLPLRLRRRLQNRTQRTPAHTPALQ